MRLIVTAVALALLMANVAGCAKPAPDMQPLQPRADAPAKPLKPNTKRVLYSQEWVAQTQAAYAQATRHVAAYAKHTDGAWAVVMDLDQTVLNNIQYHAALDARGASYAPETWRAWVEERKASLIPGARDFIEFVNQQGGKVAFVTNRRSYEQDATIDNLAALDIKKGRDYVLLLTREWPDGSDSKAERFASVPQQLARQGIGSVNVIAYLGDVVGDHPADDKVAFFCIPQGNLYGKNCQKHQLPKQ